MTAEEVKGRLSDLNRGYNSPYSSAERAAIEELYSEVFGRRLTGCRCNNRWHDAVLEIYSHIKRNGKMKEKCNYKLRAGVVLQIAGSTEIYTNDNLTDEVAAAFLKEHPQAVGRFEVVPKGRNSGEKPGKADASVRLAEAEARIAALEAENAALKARMEAAAATGEEAPGDSEGSETTGKAPQEAAAAGDGPAPTDEAAAAAGTTVGAAKSGRGRKSSPAKQ